MCSMSASEATTPSPSLSPLMQETSLGLKKVQHERRCQQEPSNYDRVDPRDPFLRPTRRDCSSGGGGGHGREREEGRTTEKGRVRSVGFSPSLLAHLPLSFFLFLSLSLFHSFFLFLSLSLSLDHQHSLSNNNYKKDQFHVHVFFDLLYAYLRATTNTKNRKLTAETPASIR